MPFDGSTFCSAAAQQSDAPGFGVGSAGAFCRLRQFVARLVRARLNETRPAAPVEVASVLWEARDLIAPEKSWLRGCYHRYPSRFCAVGALRRAGRQASPAVITQAHTLLLDVARDRGFQSVERMNDQTSHAVVLSAFDAAIAAALDQGD